MSPFTHFFISWSAASAGRLSRRDRFLVTAAGVAPDVDGLGIVADLLTSDTANPLNWWDRFHHVFGHCLGFGLAAAVLAFSLGARRRTTALLALLTFHLHLLGDLAGARGPDGYQWPIPYLLPFSDSLQLAWPGQWALNAWPNFLITALSILVSCYLAWKRGFSFVGLFSQKADRQFVAALHGRFGLPRKNF
ncbi:MAG: metal-dependent hydrolase [Thermodesulfobacteriota bacterium]